MAPSENEMNCHSTWFSNRLQLLFHHLLTFNSKRPTHLSFNQIHSSCSSFLTFSLCLSFSVCVLFICSLSKFLLQLLLLLRFFLHFCSTNRGTFNSPHCFFPCATYTHHCQRPHIPVCTRTHRTIYIMFVHTRYVYLYQCVLCCVSVCASVSVYVSNGVRISFLCVAFVSNFRPKIALVMAKMCALSLSLARPLECASLTQWGK